MDIALNSNAPHGRSHHVALEVTDVTMTISPATIRILTVTFTKAQPKKVYAAN